MKLPAMAPEFIPRHGKAGTILSNRYRLLRRLGAGGMGEVYEAEHIEIPRRFAIKLLRSEFAGDPQMQARFRREAQAAAGLSSDHIVEVSDFGHADDGAPYLVMDLLQGDDLRRVLNRYGRVSPAQAAAITSQACAGVAAAHEAGVIHRDLKPENLFLAQHAGKATVKVLDFGIAKLLHQSLGTSGGRLLGTPAYMPPEQIRGEDVDHRVDVYALGVILYEALTGRLPHPGAAQHQIISHVLFEPAVAIRDVNPAVPIELAEIVHKALATSAADRIESVTALATALAAFADTAELSPLLEGHDAANQPTLPARSSELHGTGSDAVPEAGMAEPAAVASRVRPARPRRRATLAIAALCIAIAVLWKLTRPASTATDQAARDVALATTQSGQVQPTPIVSTLNAPAAHAGEPNSSTVPEPPTSERQGSDVDGAVSPTEVTAFSGVKQPPTPTRRAEPRTQAARHSVVPTRSAAEPRVIEVRRGERTIVFKRDNPFRR